MRPRHQALQPLHSMQPTQPAMQMAPVAGAPVGPAASTPAMQAAAAAAAAGGQGQHSSCSLQGWRAAQHQRLRHQQRYCHHHCAGIGQAADSAPRTKRQHLRSSALRVLRLPDLKPKHFCWLFSRRLFSVAFLLLAGLLAKTKLRRNAAVRGASRSVQVRHTRHPQHPLRRQPAREAGRGVARRPDVEPSRLTVTFVYPSRR
jgi:hypothetical protein